MLCLGADSLFRSPTVAELAMDCVSEEPLSHSNLSRVMAFHTQFYAVVLAFQMLVAAEAVRCGKVLEEVLRSTLVSQRNHFCCAVGDSVLHCASLRFFCEFVGGERLRLCCGAERVFSNVYSLWQGI